MCIWPGASMHNGFSHGRIVSKSPYPPFAVGRGAQRRGEANARGKKMTSPLETIKFPRRKGGCPKLPLWHASRFCYCTCRKSRNTGLFDELWESSFQGGHCLFEWEHYVFPSCVRFPSRQKNSHTRNDNIPQERKEVQSFP